MSDVKIDKKAVEAAAVDLAALDVEIQRLADRARAEGVAVGRRGLLGRLTELITTGPALHNRPSRHKRCRLYRSHAAER